MSESQNIEFKESWRDEYLKWICGFANAQGGRIYIGKDDEGKVIGVNDSKKLLEDIPNKLQNTMGIIADVNLHKSEFGTRLKLLFLLILSVSHIKACITIAAEQLCRLYPDSH